MRIRRLLIVLAAVGGMFTAPVAAYADPTPTPTPSAGYPIEPPSSAISDATVPSGGAVVFSGRGFLAGEPIAIDVTFHATGAALHITEDAHPRFVAAALETVNASPTGTFSVSITLGQTGLATLTATGTISHVVVSEQVTAVVSQATSSDNLPVTGQSGRHWLTAIGVALGSILIGGLLVFAAVRPRRVRRT
jgi:LPXTG-motif cell wall-anchored protein